MTISTRPPVSRVSRSIPSSGPSAPTRAATAAARSGAGELGLEGFGLSGELPRSRDSGLEIGHAMTYLGLGSGRARGPAPVPALRALTRARGAPAFWDRALAHGAAPRLASIVTVLHKPRRLELGPVAVAVRRGRRESDTRITVNALEIRLLDHGHPAKPTLGRALGLAEASPYPVLLAEAGLETVDLVRAAGADLPSGLIGGRVAAVRVEDPRIDPRRPAGGLGEQIDSR